MTDKKKDAPLETPARFTLKTGTVVHVDGIPVRLVSDTEIESNQSNHDALAAHTDTTFEEYPKAITVDGVALTAKSADHEAELRRPAKKAGALDDVAVEMDNPAYNDPPKTKRKGTS